MRRRVIDPGFWTDSKITELSFDARLLYIGLWQYADDEGLFIEGLKSIKMVLFPDQQFPLEKTYGELATAGFFRFGTMDGAKVVEIRRFKDHQTINRPTPSKLREIVQFNDDSVSAHDDSLKTHSQVKLSKDKVGDSVSHTESDKQTPVSSPSRRERKLTRRDGIPPDPAQVAAFTQFYTAYPRHVARQAAERAWLLLSPNPELQVLIMAAVARYAAEVQNSEPKFIQHPAKWLSGRRWEDEVQSGNGGHAKPAHVKDLDDGNIEVDGRIMARDVYERRYGKTN